MQIVKKTYSSETDENIMIEVTKGDSHAFSEIYDRWSKPMLNYFYKMLWQDREKAEDFMQEIFTKIIHKPHLYNPKKSFKTWIYSVANNMCKNEYRKQEIRKGTTNSLHDNIVVKDNSKSPDKEHDKNIFNERLKEELQNLSDNHRKTFILRFKHDLSIKEIAEILETSEGTVKSRIFYTIKKLGEQLKEFNPANITASILAVIASVTDSFF